MLQDELINKLAQIGKVRLYSSPDYICYEGQPGNDMYLILKGSVGVYVSNSIDVQTEICRLGVGDFFGEMALLDNQPRSASCIALEGVVCVAISKDKLQQCIALLPGLAMKMLENLSLRVRQLNHDLYKNNAAGSSRHTIQFEIPPEYSYSHNAAQPPADQAILVPVTAVCPICGKPVVVHNMKKLHMTTRAPGSNGRPIYQECDPLWLSIWSCPHCHYSNFYTRFFSISEDEKEDIRHMLEEQHIPAIQRRADLTTAFDLLFIRYLQAIHINMAAGSNLLVGRLWQNLYWLFDDICDPEMKKYCAGKATAALSAALEDDEVDDTESRLTMQLSMTDMYGALGNSAAASRVCSEVLASVDHLQLKSLAYQLKRHYKL